MSTAYQTTAKPRERRETGASDSHSRTRAPSEAATNLNKRLSRTSDENIAPPPRLQRHRTLDRAAQVDSILPRSSSSATMPSRAEVQDSDIPLVIPTARAPPNSSPGSPLTRAAKPEAEWGSQSMHSMISGYVAPTSQPAASRSYHDIPGSFPGSFPETSHDPRPSTTDSSKTSDIKTTSDKSNLQPTVEDEKTPTVTPMRTPGPVFPPNPPPRSEPEAMPPSASSARVPSPTPYYPEQYQQGWGHTSSPPQSPMVHQQYSAYQNSAQAQYPYAYPSYPGGMQMYGNPYYPAAPFSPPMAPEYGRPPSNDGSRARSQSGDNHENLLEKLSMVLPDLHKLLNQYRENQGQILDPTPVREAILPPSEEHKKQLGKLQRELDATKKEYDKVIQTLVEENSKLKNDAEDSRRRTGSFEGSKRLRAELGSLQLQHQGLANSVDSIRLAKEQLVAEKLGHEKQIDSLKKQNHSDKDELKISLNKVQLELATLITKHTNMKKDLDATRSLESLHKFSIESLQKDLDVVKAHHVKELEGLKKDHQRDFKRVEEDSKKRITELEAVHTKKEHDWQDKMDVLHADVQTHQTSFQMEKKAHEALKGVHEDRTKKTADLAEALKSWKIKQAELQEEHAKLDVAMEALGHGTGESAKSEPLPAPVKTKVEDKVGGKVEGKVEGKVDDKVEDKVESKIESSNPNAILHKSEATASGSNVVK